VQQRGACVWEWWEAGQAHLSELCIALLRGSMIATNLSRGRYPLIPSVRTPGLAICASPLSAVTQALQKWPLRKPVGRIE